MPRRKPNLADQIETSERRAAPRLRARIAEGRNTSGPWLAVIVVSIVLIAAVVGFLHYKSII